MTVPERPALDLTFPGHAVREDGRRVPELDLEAALLAAPPPVAAV